MLAPESNGYSAVAGGRGAVPTAVVSSSAAAAAAAVAATVTQHDDDDGFRDRDSFLPPDDGDGREDLARPPPPSQPPPQTQQPVSPFTRVDGRGLWRSWKRNFKNKLLALLDLLDNSLDASIVEGVRPDRGDFVGRVHIFPDEAPAAARGGGGGGGRGARSRHFDEEQRGRSFLAPDLVRSEGPDVAESGGRSASRATGLCIVNNSVKPVRPLERVLEVYNSSKVGSGAGDIGENGVGLKQGCATLSDLSFVLVKNGKDGFVELGMIAESLQRVEGCYLPAFRFQIPDDEDVIIIQHLKAEMEDLFSRLENRNVAACIIQYGSAVEGGNPLENGIDRLCKHFESLLDFYDNDFVFEVILDHLHYGNPRDPANRRANAIQDLRAAIPRTYLHIPETFDFRIGTSRRGREKVVFHYWTQRLVELSSFTVSVNPNYPWHSDQAERGNHKLRVFLGFDRIRINASDDAKTASLYVYSRQSGRLIKVEPDARHLLGLSAGGSTYCSGLTVLIDDIEGRLPLNPTKQDVAFGEEANGDVYKANLFAWVGSVTKFFYDYHLAKYQGRKIPLTAAIKDFGTQPVETPLKGIDVSHVTSFSANFKFYGKKSIRIEQRSAQENTGPDTHFRLISEPPPPLPPPPPPLPVMNPRPVTSNSQHDNKRRRVDDSQIQAASNQHGGQFRTVNRDAMQTQHVQQPPVVPSASVRPPHPQPGAQHSQYHHQHPPQHYQQAHNHNNNSHFANVRSQQTQQVSAWSDQRAEQLNQRVQQLHGVRPPPPAPPVPSSALPPMRQGNQPPSNTTSGVRVATSASAQQAANARHAVEREFGVREGEAAGNIAPRNQNGAAAMNRSSNGAASRERSANGVVNEERSRATSGVENGTVIDLASDDDDSTASTKDYYKDLCEKLTLRVEEKSKEETKARREIRHLRQEVQLLRIQIEKQKRLLQTSTAHSCTPTPP